MLFIARTRLYLLIKWGFLCHFTHHCGDLYYKYLVSAKQYKLMIHRKIIR